MGGLIVALIMKHRDTILKGFGTSAAVVVATVLSIFIWNSPVNRWFVVVGAVIAAVVLCSKYPAEVECDSETSQKSVAFCRPCTWWLRTGLLLAVLFMVVGDIALLPPDSAQPITTHSAHRPLIGNVTSNPPQECKLRDISNFTRTMSLEPLRVNSRKKWPHCLRFQCMRDASKCDNTLATNFDGPDPPCCVHVLRDMARQFDRVMCYLGLEYVPAVGTLLGLTRSDRLIPWTADNDYIVSTATMIAMMSLWHTSSHLEHGMQLVFSGIDRMCISPSFANGKLLRWKVNGTSKLPFIDTNIYTDFYLGDYHGNNQVHIPVALGCIHNASDLRPYVRRSFYNGTLQQYFPNKPENIVRQIYGPDWRVPDPKKSEHGALVCSRAKNKKT
jgi:hypothetical protein